MEAWLGQVSSRIDGQADRERGGNLELLISWSTEGEKDGTRKGADKSVMKNQTVVMFISGHDENVQSFTGVPYNRQGWRPVLKTTT